MATVSFPIVAAPSPRQLGVDPGDCTERALFTLSKPIVTTVNGVKARTYEIRMRALNTDDLPFLDQFCGKPMGLIVNLVALLCDLTVDEVRSIIMQDFINPAIDAIWQVEQLCKCMGLPHRFFLTPEFEADAPFSNDL